MNECLLALKAFNVTPVIIKSNDGDAAAKEPPLAGFELAARYCQISAPIAQW